LKQTKLLEKDKNMITKDELGSWLWGAADILRGAVRAENYGEFILPLLFYKRLSDGYAFEYAEKFKEYGD
jgi:type I restriction enzyme M protein